ncbi:MAG: hypothetical protein MO846_00890 [Candidatus Devosia symbiotica]|nr:hypothetical protein [Candidatus Devosia symbiotica]
MMLYGERINAYQFAVVQPLIADDAVFWFGDGSHYEIAAIRQAIEATWARLTDEQSMAHANPAAGAAPRFWLAGQPFG